MSQTLDRVPVIAGLAVGVSFIVAFSFLFGMKPSIPESPENAIISIERTACFGSCPDYKLTIYGNGSVIYEGRNFVAVEGIRTGTVAPEDVRALVKHFNDINYFSLRDKYVDQVTDLPTTTTSIRIDGQFKQVVDYYGAPEELKQLENRIDEVANSEVWVKGR
jgi:hypothetical protein